ncbi:helicase-related protein, partial [Candidatus Neomarinimicrobiota bacterium]
MTSAPFTIGMTIRSRGERFIIVDMHALPSREEPLTRLTLRGLEGELQGKDLTILHPIDNVVPDEIPDLALERPGRLARFRLLHDVFRLRASPPTDVLIGASRSRIRFEPYQYVPSKKALELPRPRLLLADDVGLGKTIEAGLVLRDLAARRRANRILIVCPAGIMHQWQEELESKFGFRFKIFDRDTIHETRLLHEIGANPWSIEPRVIASMDFIKRREGAFRELSSSKWDVVIVDEAHHLSRGRSEGDITDRHRLGRWLSDATDALILMTATPHDGYDESFSSLLGLLEPSLVMPDGAIHYQRYSPHLIRRLKRHIRNPDGSEKFLRRQVDPIPVDMSSAEQKLHDAVVAQARGLEEFATSARRRIDAEAIRLVATILRKRAASSRAALAQTIQNRQDNLSERIEELEIQRDHLRALRRGDTVSDDDLTRLEKDAHRTYLSVIRRLGQSVRRAETEQEELTNLSELLEACQSEPDSKLTRLLETLREVCEEYPNDKVIIFSEYVDTVDSIKTALETTDNYAGKCCSLAGESSRLRRQEILSDFFSDQKLILIATDAAGEGLNLHEYCHRIIHFELPWNPNRLEQRNGRIDRYGQDQIPLIGFLYSQRTYEG